MDSEAYLAMIASVVSISTVLLVGWTVWLYSRRTQEKVRAVLEIQRRTLEKFATADEFIAFASSEAGRRFLESVSTEQSAHVRRILGSIQKGTVLSLLGLGLGVLPSIERDLAPLAFFGVVAFATGVGYLISAALSYRLSKRWGLLPPAVP